MWTLMLILACDSSDSKVTVLEGEGPAGDSSDLDPSDSDPSDSDTGESDTGELPDISGWTGGNFDFETLDIKDGCLGGAFEALFMPEGPDVPHAFEYQIYIPGFEDLPEVYTIDLRKPFVEMPVSVDSPDGRTYEIRGSVMSAVELGQIPYGDCVVTMTVDVDLTPVNSDTAEGTASIEISDARGEDGLCPVFEVSPCTVDLELRASRS